MAAPPEPDALEQRYVAGADPGDLMVLGPSDRAGAARSHAELAARREPGQAIVRVLNPSRSRDGWETPHTVVEVVTDDMPFLVDSLSALLARRGYEVHLLLHPVVDAVSFVHAEIDRESDRAVLDELARAIESVLADVRVAVEDWAAMRDRALALAAMLRMRGREGDDDAEEAAVFLEWLVDDHFTFVAACDAGQGEPLGIARRRPLAGLAGPGPGDRASQLTLTKATERSTVHRAVPLDLVAVDGQLLLGLYTADAYSESTDDLPVVRRKVAGVMETAGFDPTGHDGRALRNVLETIPRDELFRLGARELRSLAIGIVRLGERRRVRVFANRDASGRFASFLVYLPRDRYTTPVRIGIIDALQRGIGGDDVDFTVTVSESVLARLHIVVQTPAGAPSTIDERALEAEIAEIARDWTDELRDALVAARGEEPGLDTFRAWGDAFPAAYRADATAATAVRDIAVLEGRPELAIRLDQPVDDDAVARLALYRSGAPFELSAVMPVLEHLDVVVVDERPYAITPRDGGRQWISCFTVRSPGRAAGDGRAGGELLAAPGTQDRVAELFLGVWAGEIENDGLNRLVLRAGLAARQVVLLRALVKYLHQAGVRFTEASFADALASNPAPTRLVVELFQARFDPALDERARARDVERIGAELDRATDAVASLDEDRILRALTAVVRAAVRTNWYRDGRRVLAIKLDPTALAFLPDPRPAHEIWVYSARVEGVHLRGGDIARGGVRWSDRRDDFRTEVLGLVKAQTEKNAVIVPVGAKGGFVVERPPSNPPALRDEVTSCYRDFVRGLLDVTDNIVGGVVVAPPRVVRHDHDDPYLVVAADKGTATFSDDANALAAEYGFWLGDAFASGGSSGYDHKEMGITSRGAWISARAHFRAMGVDADTAALAVVGIGDMSGDVFGNGMLRSSHLRLLAAFDHRHVFVDPDPDPSASFAERRRLFALPASSWADYDASLISPGGGVYERSAKAVTLSPEARGALGVEAETLTPDELVSAVLRAPADLLWNGGIGTFVKARAESDAEVGDRGNDSIRVDATELRCKVVVEGGNLGLTQAARVEYALAGGRVNSDAIDNSAGVDCSDHEVNIKILLRGAIDDGVLAAPDRDPLLAAMTDEVASLVLADNEAQTNALEIAAVEAPTLVGVHARQIDRLEHAGVIDRALEGLPDAKALQERHAAGQGLTAPELGVLLAFTKLELQRELVGSDVPDDPYVRAALHEYFPRPLRERFPDQIDAHRLAREIVATALANSVVNRAGISFFSRMADEIGTGSSVLVRAHIAARDVFDVTATWSAIDALDLVVPASVQDEMFLSARRLVERAARWLVRRADPGVVPNGTRPAGLATTVARLRDPVERVLAHLRDLVVGADAQLLASEEARLTAAGVPTDLASRVASFVVALGALVAADVADATGRPVDEVAAVYYALADRLRLDRLRDRIAALPRADRWQTEARAALRDDVADIHRGLTEQAVVVGGTVDDWLATRAEAVGRYLAVVDDVEAGAVFDLATLGAVRRELRDVVGVTGGAG
ncbi:MAG TPA: NAD-glutamate dehydrogenase [Acidimicrobiia bacterium]